jgi:hypothetical protein
VIVCLRVTTAEDKIDWSPSILTKKLSLIRAPMLDGVDTGQSRIMVVGTMSGHPLTKLHVHTSSDLGHQTMI